MSNKKVLCPASELGRDTWIIGAIQADGVVRFIGKPVPAIAEFRTQANKRGQPEQYFRFASACRRHDCDKWKEGACSVAGALRRTVQANPRLKEQEAPACGMREHCLWERSCGPLVCRACRYVGSDARQRKTVHFCAPPAPGRKERAA